MEHFKAGDLVYIEESDCVVGRRIEGTEYLSGYYVIISSTVVQSTEYILSIDLYDAARIVIFRILIHYEKALEFLRVINCEEQHV